MTSIKSEQSKLINANDSEDDLQDSNSQGCAPLFCRFPASVYFIITNEFCERFNYFGVRTILTLYLLKFIGLDANNTTAIYHLFVVLCYLSSILGGVLADGLLGRFWTILILSIVYCVGGIVLSATALPGMGLVGALIGLLLISVGTGGIKPNVSAFGADQLPANNAVLHNAYFSCFYFFINFGSLLAVMFVPIIRSNVDCFGADCYSLAFGVSTVVMLLSIVIFACGKPKYKCSQPSKSVLLESVYCLISAVRNYRAASIRDSDKQLLDYADPERFSPQFIADLRQFSSLLLLYIPFPIFWSLFDQIGSRWTIQASLMDGYIAAGLTILPDQIQALNSLLILVCIPIFDCIIYPLLAKVHIRMPLLRRMGAGMLLASAAFVAAMLVQLHIDSSATVKPHKEQIKLKLVNALADCDATVDLGDIFSERMLSKSFSSALLVDSKKKLPELRVNSADCDLKLRRKLSLPDGNNSFDIVFFKASTLQVSVVPASLAKHRRGLAQLRVMSLLPADSEWSSATLLLRRASRSAFNVQLPLPAAAAAAAASPVTSYAPIHSGFYLVKLVRNHSSAAAAADRYQLRTVAPRSGQVLTLIIAQDTKHKLHTVLIEDVRANSVKMLWQVPQYVLISVAEVLFSISGLSFSYAEAPNSMKSLVQSLWLLCVGIGNVVVMIVSEVRLLPNQSQEFLMFAALMLLNVALFTFLSLRYKPRHQFATESAAEMQLQEDSSKDR